MLSAIFLLLLFSAGVNAQSVDKVIVREDNDIVTFLDSVSSKETLPPVLKVNITNLISKRCKELAEDCDRNNIYFQTFKINSGDGNILYITELNEDLSGFQIYLCLYNSANDIYSDFFNIDGMFMYNNEEGFQSWNGRLIEKPYISFADLDKNGKKEILFQRRAHNGTWNAVETIALKPDDSGSLKKYFSFYSKELKGVGTETMTVRKIKSVINGTVTLGVTSDDTTFHIGIEMPDETIKISQ